jgi:hypothetical protein
VGDVELHLFQGLGEKDVEPASTIDKHLVEFGARDHRLQDEGEPSWFREAGPLIRTGEGDGYLRPPERGRDRWLNGHYFTTGSLLLPPAGQSAEEDIDGLVRLLEVVVVAVLLLALFVVRVRWLRRILECVPELVALLGGVVAVWVPRAPFLQ